ncbi:MAG: alcohol dehydrogenase catalytic domain-containing protein [Blautia faecis]
MTIDEREIPEPAADEVLIKIMACGVCGSDVLIFFGDQGSTSSIPPLIQGHEFSGVVVKIGKDVVECKVGEIKFVQIRQITVMTVIIVQMA